jgi:N-acetylmuramoyl-L-alanine amidase
MKVGLFVGHGFGSLGAENREVGGTEHLICREIVDSANFVLGELGVPVVSCNDSLSSKVRFANICEVDLAVEVHLNSHLNVQSNGCEVLVYEVDQDLTSAIAKSLSFEISSVLDIEDRGVKAGVYWGGYQNGKKTPLHFLRFTAMPAIVIECFFLSNVEEARRCIPLTKQIGDRIASVIHSYQEEIDFVKAS